MSYQDYDYREIITKAVCGKGRKFTKEINYCPASHKPSTVLGCWIINHSYHANKKNKDCVEIHGNYDINIWYSYADNSKTEVISETIKYCDEVVLNEKDQQCTGSHYDVVAKVVQQPNCLQCNIEKKGNKIAVEVEREFIVKIIGETKVNVKVEPVHHVHYEDEHGPFKGKEHRGFMKDKTRP